MKQVLALLAVLVPLFGCSAPESRPHAQLDTLFERLRSAASADEAAAIQGNILKSWSKSGKAEVDTLVSTGIQALHRGQSERALAIFTKVTTDAPQFAEGWNLRAMVRFLRDEYPEAIGDIEHVLALEPR
ncbi:MAG: hypothetical protein K2Q10_02370, partial [Rhodospirillales bacterium]|nr:hypothetical protein [Rhodospirillales bacterium]